MLVSLVSRHCPVFAGVVPVMLAWTIGSAAWVFGYADVIPSTGDSKNNAANVDLEMQRLRPAIEAFQRGDADAFQVAYSMAAKELAGLPALEIYWAKLLADSGRLSESLNVLEKYVRENLADPDAHLLMGRIALASGRWTDAWLQLERAQQLVDAGKADSARRAKVELPLLELRAQTAERRGQWKLAEEIYSKAQKLKPEAAMYAWGIGKVRVFAGDVQAGFQIMADARKQDPKLPEAALSVAQILTETLPWRVEPEAVKQIDYWFQQARQEEQSETQTLSAFYNWLLQTDRAQELVMSFEELAETLQQDRQIQFLRSLAARYLNDMETAESLLVPLHQTNPEDPEIANQLALVLVESKDEAKRGRALQLAEKNLRQFSNSEAVIGTAAWIQFRLGASDVADRMLGELAKRQSLSAQTAYYAAELLASRGLAEESRKMLKAALENPGIFPQRAAAKTKLNQ